MNNLYNAFTTFFKFQTKIISSLKIPQCITIFCLIAVSTSIPAFAQTDAMLTKEETAKYIAKKLKECISYRVGDFVFENLFSADDCKLFYSTTYNNYVEFKEYSNIETQLQFDFDATLIKEIVDLGGEEIDGGAKLKIILSSSVGSRRTLKKEYVERKEWGHGYRDVFGVYRDQYLPIFKYETTIDTVEKTNIIVMNYLRIDNTSFGKIKKALEHFAKLCKAEDDPFGQ